MPARNTPQARASAGAGNQPAHAPTMAPRRTTFSRIGAAAALAKRSTAFSMPDSTAISAMNIR